MFSHAFSIIQSRSLVLSACITIRIHPIMPPCLCVCCCVIVVPNRFTSWPFRVCSAS